jgi:hypothetical protein
MATAIPGGSPGIWDHDMKGEVNRMTWDSIATLAFFIVFSVVGIWYTCVRKTKDDKKTDSGDKKEV